MKFLCKKDYLLKHYLNKVQNISSICYWKKSEKVFLKGEYYNCEEVSRPVSYYKDYFMTNIEIRKKKLEKIHNFSMIFLLKERLSRFYLKRKFQNLLTVGYKIIKDF